MTSITFIGYFLNQMCVLLNAFYGSCLTLNDLAICTENTLCVFKICPFTWLFQDMRLTNKYCSYACGASKFQMPSAKGLSHYPLCFERRSDLSNITCWYLKLLHDNMYLLAMSIDCI